MSRRAPGTGQRPDEPDPHDPAADVEARAGVSSPVEQFVRTSLRQIRRLAILLVGTTVVLVGLIMLVTPGPALVVVPLGLAILAIEFAWARRLLHNVRARAARVRDDYRRRDN